MTRISFRSTCQMNRATQLDALILDNELASIITEQLINILRSFNIHQLPFIRSQQDVHKCINGLVSVVLLLRNNATFGMKTYNLKLSTSTSNLFNVLRIMILSLMISFEEDISCINPVFKKLFKSLKLLNFLLFICHGQHPSLLFRILSLEVCAEMDSSKSSTLFIDDEHTNRRIMWQSLTELLQLGIPFYHTYIKPSLSLVHEFIPLKHPMMLTNSDACNICGLRDGVKAILKCKHVYCWYCLQKESNGKCLQC